MLSWPGIIAYRSCDVDAPLYLRNEARICLQLARAEAHPEVKLILMGMALGWLNLADEMKR
jgi:hypothetical protein